MDYISPFVTGFLIGASLIIAIGTQNAFILRMGLLRRHVFALALFCAVSDAILIAAGVLGLGAALSHHARIASAISLFGAAFLFWYGARALHRALHPVSMDEAQANAGSLKSALFTCAAFTWANPHVYIDMVLLIGSLSLPFAGLARLAYGAGAASCSFVWFFGLGYGARLLTPLFRKPVTWQWLDGGIAAIMWLIATKLILSVIA